MGSLTKQVWNIIEGDHAIKTCLRKGLLNQSALAKNILEKYKLQGSVDGVISAIRRYEMKEVIEEEFLKIKKALTESSISTRTKIVSLLLKNLPTSYSIMLSSPLKEICLKDESVHILKNPQGIYIVGEEKALEQILKYFPEDSTTSVKTNLAQISIKLTPDGWKTRGVLALLSNELTSAGVNIVLIASANPYINFFVKEEDLKQGHEAVLKLCKG